jgi:hypothetical protein
MTQLTSAETAARRLIDLLYVACLPAGFQLNAAMERRDQTAYD